MPMNTSGIINTNNPEKMERIKDTTTDNNNNNNQDNNQDNNNTTTMNINEKNKHKSVSFMDSNNSNSNSNTMNRPRKYSYDSVIHYHNNNNNYNYNYEEEEEEEEDNEDNEKDNNNKDMNNRNDRNDMSDNDITQLNEKSPAQHQKYQYKHKQHKQEQEQEQHSVNYQNEYRNNYNNSMNDNKNENNKNSRKLENEKNEQQHVEKLTQIDRQEDNNNNNEDDNDYTHDNKNNSATVNNTTNYNTITDTNNTTKNNNIHLNSINSNSRNRNLNQFKLEENLALITTSASLPLNSTSSSSSDSASSDSTSSDSTSTSDILSNNYNNNNNNANNNINGMNTNNSNNSSHNNSSNSLNNTNNNSSVENSAESIPSAFSDVFSSASFHHFKNNINHNDNYNNHQNNNQNNNNHHHHHHHHNNTNNNTNTNSHNTGTGGTDHNSTFPTAKSITSTLLNVQNEQDDLLRDMAQHPAFLLAKKRPVKLTRFPWLQSLEFEDESLEAAFDVWNSKNFISFIEGNYYYWGILGLFISLPLYFYIYFSLNNFNNNNNNNNNLIFFTDSFNPLQYTLLQWISLINTLSAFLGIALPALAWFLVKKEGFAQKYWRSYITHLISLFSLNALLTCYGFIFAVLWTNPIYNNCNSNSNSNSNSISTKYQDVKNDNNQATTYSSDNNNNNYNSVLLSQVGRAFFAIILTIFYSTMLNVTNHLLSLGIPFHRKTLNALGSHISCTLLLYYICLHHSNSVLEKSSISPTYLFTFCLTSTSIFQFICASHSFHSEHYRRAVYLILQNKCIQIGLLRRSKADFLSLVSHELKTPLSTILGVFELFDCDDRLSSDQRENLTLMATAARRLQARIQNMLQFARFFRLAEGWWLRRQHAKEFKQSLQIYGNSNNDSSDNKGSSTNTNKASNAELTNPLLSSSTSSTTSVSTEPKSISSSPSSPSSSSSSSSSSLSTSPIRGTLKLIKSKLTGSSSTSSTKQVADGKPSTTKSPQQQALAPLDKINIASVSFRFMMDEIVEYFIPRATIFGVKLNLHVDHQIASDLVGDFSLIRHVLFKLVDTLVVNCANIISQNVEGHASDKHKASANKTHQQQQLDKKNSSLIPVVTLTTLLQSDMSGWQVVEFIVSTQISHHQDSPSSSSSTSSSTVTSPFIESANASNTISSSTKSQFFSKKEPFSSFTTHDIDTPEESFESDLKAPFSSAKNNFENIAFSYCRELLLSCIGSEMNVEYSHCDSNVFSNNPNNNNPNSNNPNSNNNNNNININSNKNNESNSTTEVDEDNKLSSDSASNSSDASLTPVRCFKISFSAMFEIEQHIPDTSLVESTRATTKEMGFRVLVLANEKTCKSIREQLIYDGCSVFSATSPEAAKTLTMKENPHLILLDLAVIPIANWTGFVKELQTILQDNDKKKNMYTYPSSLTSHQRLTNYKGHIYGVASYTGPESVVWSLCSQNKDPSFSTNSEQDDNPEPQVDGFDGILVHPIRFGALSLLIQYVAADIKLRQFTRLIFQMYIGGSQESHHHQHEAMFTSSGAPTSSFSRVITKLSELLAKRRERFKMVHIRVCSLGINSLGGSVKDAFLEVLPDDEACLDWTISSLARNAKKTQKDDKPARASALASKSTSSLSTVHHSVSIANFPHLPKKGVVNQRDQRNVNVNSNVNTMNNTNANINASINAYNASINNHRNNSRSKINMNNSISFNDISSSSDGVENKESKSAPNSLSKLYPVELSSNGDLMDSGTPRSLSNETTRTVVPLSRFQIVVVESNALSRLLLNVLLKKLPFSFEFAQSFNEAQEMLQTATAETTLNPDDGSNTGEGHQAPVCLVLLSTNIFFDGFGDQILNNMDAISKAVRELQTIFQSTSTRIKIILLAPALKESLINTINTEGTRSNAESNKRESANEKTRPNSPPMIGSMAAVELCARLGVEDVIFGTFDSETLSSKVSKHVTILRTSDNFVATSSAQPNLSFISRNTSPKTNVTTSTNSDLAFSFEDASSQQGSNVSRCVYCLDVLGPNESGYCKNCEVEMKNGW